ncbi:MAG: hypothetical protein OER96_04325 [Gammaproteobacteria bacterium]|nr:hypothetical protein [Gammaproteobacteria bacterium]
MTTLVGITLVIVRVYVILLLGLLTGCSQPSTWSGSINPNRQDLTDWVSLGLFESRIGCEAVAIDVLARLGALTKGDYECGLNCRRDPQYSLLVCDATEKSIDPALLPANKEPLKFLHGQCMAQIATLYQSRFFTVQYKLWNKLGFGGPDDRRDFEALLETVDCLIATSRDVVPTKDLGPAEFEASYNLHAKYLKLNYQL